MRLLFLLTIFFSNAVLANSLLLPSPAMDAREQVSFFAAQSFVAKPWVIAPSSTSARDGLGPLYNASSCRDCHKGNARSSLDIVHNKSPVAKTDQSGHVLGHQLQFKAIPGFQPEADVDVVYQEYLLKRKGFEYALNKPVFKVAHENNTAQSSKAYSFRNPPILNGSARFQGVDINQLKGLADPEDKNKDGISGRLRVLDNGAVGVYGWKNELALLKDQLATALYEDMGLSSDLIADYQCERLSCPEVQSQIDVEQGIFDMMLYYLEELSLPINQAADDKVLGGEKVFNEIGCASCHVRALKTHKGVINPYTDLLLHDMGEALSDHTGSVWQSEWRTAPLWGISRIKDIEPEAGFLHDGRARNVLEAILWHGGEAEAARDRFISLEFEQKTILLEFLNTL